MISNAEDALAIGNHDDADFFVGAILKQLPNVVAQRIRNNQAARAPVDVAEFLARLCNHGRVNDGQHLLDVIEKKAVEKNLVGVLELAEINVTLEIVVLAQISFLSASGLFFNGFDYRREKPIKAEGLALLRGGGGAFVQGRHLQQRTSAQMRSELGQGR